MTPLTIHLPTLFEEFKQHCSTSELENPPKMTLRWNDLSPEGKTQLATNIKKHTPSQTIRKQPITASIEKIISALDIFNPILDQTSCYGSRWAFSGNCCSTAHWLHRISRVLVFLLQLRKQSPSIYYDIFISYGNWKHHRFARSLATTERQLETSRREHRSTNPPTINEISLSEISSINRIITSNRNNKNN